jgi:protein-S-isoprenylcysteine O-methyltransferase Ste14
MSLRKLLTGTKWDFANRIPLTFYPLLFVCMLGLFFDPSLDIAQFGWVSKLVILTVFFFGLGLRLWGSAILTSDVVMDASAHTDCLITHGPFAHIRHPLYTGAGFMLGAMMVFLPAWLVIPFLIFEGIMGIRLALFEEELMTERFGELYIDYKANSGRFLPPIFMREHLARSSSKRLDLRQALTSESLFILYGLFLGMGLWLKNKNLLFTGVILSSLLLGLILKRKMKQARL